MGQATLAVCAGPGDGERLYRAAADAFGFPAWEVLRSAVQTVSLDDVDVEAFPELRFFLLEEAGAGETGAVRHHCVVERIRDEKERAAIVSSDGGVIVKVTAADSRKLDELFVELGQILAALPGHTRLRVVGLPRTAVYDTTVAELCAELVNVACDATGPEGEGAEPDWC